MLHAYLISNPFFFFIRTLLPFAPSFLRSASRPVSQSAFIYPIYSRGKASFRYDGLSFIFHALYLLSFTLLLLEVYAACSLQHRLGKGK
ncbi:hypothetical protein BZA77DRAFT_313236 [Pyronema omphalodes]|nr:hypothetical protein BZA77DRAFT_313236 [Pyronema omphalodes]